MITAPTLGTLGSGSFSAAPGAHGAGGALYWDRVSETSEIPHLPRVELYGDKLDLENLATVLSEGGAEHEIIVGADGSHWLCSTAFDGLI